MAKQPLSRELVFLANQARVLEDQIAAMTHYGQRASLFYAETADGSLASPTPWELWQEWALEDGVSDSLAALGAAVIYAAHDQAWPEALRLECGWSDGGQAMIALAQQDPERAEIRWAYLLGSEGDFCHRD